MNQPRNAALRIVERALIVAALIAAGGCVTWPYETAGYYGDPYDPYGEGYGRHSHSFDYGLYYGRPFYSTYDRYPYGYYYDPHFIGRVRRPITRPPADPPPASPPPATPPPSAVVRPTPPRDFNPPPRQVRPVQPSGRPAPRTSPDRDDARPRQPHRMMPD
ncbi:MAG: hypothetical protein ACREVN_00855 [Gammaproteobacteria bacterium]